ncbi:MAG: dihydropteroate synthase [Chloroflexota bacterium]
MGGLQIGPAVFDWGSRTYVMGVLNMTPDSFSGDGLYAETSRAANEKTVLEQALQQAENFLKAGVDILDVGGESTRPGSQLLAADEELHRVIPLIEALTNRFPQAVISIDTYKAVVAEQAFLAGAHILNDVWGLRADPLLAAVAAKHSVPVILMHNRSKPSNAQIQSNLGGRYIRMEYDNLLEDIRQELLGSVQIARQAGIADEKIILDPGIGFGKTVEQNLELVNRLGEIRSLGFPVLLGPSRKSFIGFTLNLPPEQRVEGTAAAVSVGIVRGADIIRVHDVEIMVRVARMTDAVIRAKK